MKRRCHGKKWPWNGFANHAKSVSSHSWAYIKLIEYSAGILAKNNSPHAKVASL